MLTLPSFTPQSSSPLLLPTTYCLSSPFAAAPPPSLIPFIVPSLLVSPTCSPLAIALPPSLFCAYLILTTYLILLTTPDCVHHSNTHHCFAPLTTSFFHLFFLFLSPTASAAASADRLHTALTHSLTTILLRQQFHVRNPEMKD